MNNHAANDLNGSRKSRYGPGWIVVSEPGAVLHTEVLPLEGELLEGLTINVGPGTWPPGPDSILDKNGYFKPPRVPRPANLRWWERLAYAWRGL